MAGSGLKNLRKEGVRINLRVEVAPYLHVRFTYRFGEAAEEREEAVSKEYRGPKSTSVPFVEVVFENRREYGFPKTTGGFY